MEEWKECKLGDYCDFQNGYAFKSSEFKTNGEYKIVKIKELKDGLVKFFDDSASVDIQDIKEFEKYKIYRNDVLFALTGDPVSKPNPLSWVGRVSIYRSDENALLNQRTCKIKKSERIDNKFLYYYFRQWENFYALASKATGSASQANISTNTIADTIIKLPPLPTQQKIAAILSSLDDKIELNNKINTNLEQQAQALFKNWFVDFEPFGGKMPEGWKEIPLEELCTVVTKGTTPTTLGKKFTDSGINFIKGESILDNHTFDLQKISHIDDETNLMLKRSIIQPNDILFTIAGTLGRFAFIDETLTPANTNQAVGIIRANPEIISPYYLYSFFIGNWHNDYYTKRIQQAVQANLSLGTIKSLPIIIPDSQNLDKYTSIIAPIFKQMKQLENENKALSNLRDTLLPKLMNGEIVV